MFKLPLHNGTVIEYTTLITDNYPHYIIVATANGDRVMVEESSIDHDARRAI